MGLELKRQFWARLNINEVNYSGAEWKCSNERKRMLSVLEKFYGDLLNGMQLDATAAYGLFVTSATLLKHEGFREEREVRIGASPTTKLMLQSHRRAESSRQFLAPLKLALA